MKGHLRPLNQTSINQDEFLEALNPESRKMLHFPLYPLQDNGYRGGVHLINSYFKP